MGLNFLFLECTRIVFHCTHFVHLIYFFKWDKLLSHDVKYGLKELLFLLSRKHLSFIFVEVAFESILFFKFTPTLYELVPKFLLASILFSLLTHCLELSILDGLNYCFLQRQCKVSYFTSIFLLFIICSNITPNICYPVLIVFLFSF